MQTTPLLLTRPDPRGSRIRGPRSRRTRPPQIAAQSSAAQAAIPQTEGESAAWRGTLARVAESVVAIEIDQTRGVRHRVEFVRAGHGLRGRCRARPDPHEPPRRDSRTR
jgi:hypothetical protein